MKVAEAAGWGPEDSFSLGEQKLRAGLDLGIGEELTELAGAVPVVDDQNLVAAGAVAGAGVDVVTEVAEGASGGNAICCTGGLVVELTRVGDCRRVDLAAEREQIGRGGGVGWIGDWHGVAPSRVRFGRLAGWDSMRTCLEFDWRHAWSGACPATAKLFRFLNSSVNRRTSASLLMVTQAVADPAWKGLPLPVLLNRRRLSR